VYSLYRLVTARRHLCIPLRSRRTMLEKNKTLTKTAKLPKRHIIPAPSHGAGLVVGGRDAGSSMPIPSHHQPYKPSHVQIGVHTRRMVPQRAPWPMANLCCLGLEPF
jgi:hypothetical protein